MKSEDIKICVHNNQFNACNYRCELFRVGTCDIDDIIVQDIQKTETKESWDELVTDSRESLNDVEFFILNGNGTVNNDFDIVLYCLRKQMKIKNDNKEDR